MFKEQKFVCFEIVPSMSGRPRRRPKHAISAEKKQEIYKEIKDKEKKEKEDTVKVAENLIDELEFSGIKCKRCGSKSIKEDKQAIKKDPKNVMLYCIDCKYKWEEEHSDRALRQ